MAYIGKTPVIGNFQKCDSIAVVNGQAAYTLQVGGTNVSPQSENHMLVSLNGILQAPVDSFTVSGSTLTFASNLITGDVIDFVMILGNVLDLGVPSDNTVSTAKLQDSSVSLAKLTATGTKDATTFLRGDNTFAEAGGGITEVDMFRLTAGITGSGGSSGDITSNLERVDTYFDKIGTGMTNTSGVFTFPSTGIYLVRYTIFCIFENTTENINFQIKYSSDNGSTYNDAAFSGVGTTSGWTPFGQATLEAILDITDTSNDEVKFSYGSLSPTSQMYGSTNNNQTCFTFIRLGDT
jgi:hypothetical protein